MDINSVTTIVQVFTFARIYAYAPRQLHCRNVVVHAKPNV